MSRYTRKRVGLFLASILFLTQILLPHQPLLASIKPLSPSIHTNSLWAKRKALISNSFHHSENKKTPSAWQDSIPRGMVSVDKIIEKDASLPWVVIFQDIHNSFEAQKNMAATIERLSHAVPGLVVGLEGAKGPLKFAPYKELAEPDLMEEIGLHFLKKGFIGGPQFVGLTAPHPIQFFGVEDEKLYSLNVGSLFLSEKRRSNIQSRLERISRQITKAQDITFNSSLLNLRHKKSLLAQNKIELADYLNDLSSHGSDLMGGDLRRFAKASNLEKGLNPSQIEIERKRVLEKLIPRLSTLEQEKLSRLASSYQQGSIEANVFYSALTDLCRNNNIELALTPALHQFIAYLSISQSLNRLSLFSELEKFENKIVTKLSSHPAQRELWSLSSTIDQIFKLIHHNLTSSEWSQLSSFLPEIDQIGERVQMLANESVRVPLKEKDLTPFVGFYLSAEKRNSSLVDNLLSINALKERSPRILVVGGFHTDGILQELQPQNFNIMVLTPKISNVPDQHYTAVFGSERTPLDKVLAGEKLFLQRWLGVGAQPNSHLPGDVSNRIEGNTNYMVLLSLTRQLFRQLNGLSRDEQQAAVENLNQSHPNKIKLLPLSVSDIEFSLLDHGSQPRIAISFTGPMGTQKMVFSPEELDSDLTHVLLDKGNGFSVTAESASFFERVLAWWKGPQSRVVMSNLHGGSLVSLVSMLYQNTLDPDNFRMQVAEYFPSLGEDGKTLTNEILEGLANSRPANFLWMATSLYAAHLYRNQIGRSLLSNEAEQFRLAVQQELENKSEGKFGEIQVEIVDDETIVKDSKNYVAATFIRSDRSSTLYVGRRFAEELWRNRVLEWNPITALAERELAYQELLRDRSFDEAHDQVSKMNTQQKALIDFSIRFVRNITREEKTKESFSNSNSFNRTDPKHQKEQKTKQSQINNQLKDQHEQLVQESKVGSPSYTGQIVEGVISQLEENIRTWNSDGTEHIILVGEELDGSAQAVLTRLANGTNWNDALARNNRPQVHLLDTLDEKTISALHSKITAAREHVRIVWVGSPQHSEFRTIVSALQDSFPEAVEEENDSQLYNQQTLPLLAAGLFHEDFISRVHQGSKEEFENWSNSDGEEVLDYPAYQLAGNMIRMALSGQNLLVLLMFSTTLRYFSPWLSDMMMRAISSSSLKAVITGEWATSYFHSSLQGWRQSLGKNAKKERRGFIGLVFLNPKEEEPSQISSDSHVHRHYRGYGFRSILNLFRTGLGITMYAAHRPYVEMELYARTPYELGQFIQQAQLSSAMMGKLANHFSPAEPNGNGNGDKKTVVHESHHSLQSGELDRLQNILTVEEDDHGSTLNGVIGEKIEMELETASKEKPTLEKVMKVLSSVQSALKSKVLKKFTNKEGLEHLSVDSIRKDAVNSAQAAELFNNKKRIYAVSIGGSTTGPILASTLGLTKGPEIIEVQSLDSHQMENLINAITKSENPDEIGIVVISKSGVTIEVDANGWTLIEQLKKSLSQKNPSADVRNNVLFITDPQVGSLRDKVYSEGWRSLDHPVSIGGRWSMFSSVGLFFYFVKGGDANALEDALKKVETWDEQLKTALESLDAVKADLKSSDPNTIRHAIKTIQEGLIPIPGIWEGVLDHVLEQHGYDTEAALAWDESFRELISHLNPFYPQLRVESKSKPGARFYTIARWGWNAVKTLLGLLSSNPQIYATVYSIAHPEHTISKKVHAQHSIRFTETLKDLESKNVPFMATRTGPMNIDTLVQLMFYQYRRLAADAALHKKPEMDSEGQVGVEQTKGIVRSLLSLLATSIGRLFSGSEATDEFINNQKRVGVIQPEIARDRIDESNEVEMDLGVTFGLESNQEEIIKSILLGNDQSPGLVPKKGSPLTLMKPQVLVNYISGFFESRFKPTSNSSADSSLNDLIHSVIVDGRISNLAGDGRYVIRATSVDSVQNAKTGTANGTSFAIYERLADELTLKVSVQIIWGSSTRVMISNGVKTQDYILKPNDHLIEIDRAGDDNSIVMEVKGSYLASGGVSSERPFSYQHFEKDIQRLRNTSIRYADAFSADAYTIMNKQGVLSTWATWGEAIELAHTMEASRGLVMVMTETGMRHVKDIPITEDLIKNQEKIFIFAGSLSSVQEIQVFMDYLDVYSDTGESVVLNIIDTLQQLSSNTSIQARAAALTWAIRVQNGLEFLPALSDLKGKTKQTVSALKTHLPVLIESLNFNDVVDELTSHYIDLGSDIARGENRESFTLLGNSKVGLRFNPAIKTGDDLSVVYDLERDFQRVSPWDLLKRIEADETSGISDQLKTIEPFLKRSYDRNKNATEKSQFESTVDSTAEFAEDIRSYMRDSVGVTDAVRNDLGLDSNSLPEEAQEAFFKIFDVYLRKQDVTHILDADEIKKLQDKEPSIFETTPDGKTYVQSLHSIRRTLKENKYDAISNLSGDISSRLDHIYNTLLVEVMKDYVDLIISEEEDEIIYGRRETPADQSRLALFLDPIDGSSQVKDGMTFGKIGTLGYVKPGQKISDFNPRTQVVASFDAQFGWPRTLINFVNRFNPKKGKGEVANFDLDDSSENPADWQFNKSGQYDSLSQLENGLEWQGLLPHSQDGRFLGFAMGGSFESSLETDGHKQIVQYFMDTYHYLLSYTGALVNDIRKLLRIPRQAMGVLHTYGATTKHKNGRFRLTFEEWHYSIMYEILGGEVITGLGNMLEERMPEEDPGGEEREFYAGSRWITKFVMAWRNHVRTNLDGRKVTEKDFLEYKTQYIRSSEQLILGINMFSQEHQSTKTLSDIREAILRINGDISFLFNLSLEESYHRLFGEFNSYRDLAENLIRWMTEQGKVYTVDKIQDRLIAYDGDRDALRALDSRLVVEKLYGTEVLAPSSEAALHFFQNIIPGLFLTVGTGLWMGTDINMVWFGIVLGLIATVFLHELGHSGVLALFGRSSHFVTNANQVSVSANDGKPVGFWAALAGPLPGIIMSIFILSFGPATDFNMFFSAVMFFINTTALLKGDGQIIWESLKGLSRSARTEQTVRSIVSNLDQVSGFVQLSLPRVQEEINRVKKKFEVVDVDLTLSAEEITVSANFVRQNTRLVNNFKSVQSDEALDQLQQSVLFDLVEAIYDPSHSSSAERTIAMSISLVQALRQTSLDSDAISQIVSQVGIALSHQRQPSLTIDRYNVVVEDVSTLVSSNVPKLLTARRAQEFAKALRQAKGEGRPLVLVANRSVTFEAISKALANEGIFISIETLKQITYIANASDIVVNGMIDLEGVVNLLASSGSTGFGRLFGFSSSSEVKIKLTTDNVGRFVNLSIDQLVATILILVDRDVILSSRMLKERIESLSASLIAA